MTLITRTHVHPFPLFEAPLFQRSAKAVLSTRATEDEAALGQLRKTVFEPLCQALDRGGSPEILGTVRLRNDTAVALGIGEHLFPVVSWTQGKMTEISVFPPVRRDRVSPDDLRASIEMALHADRERGTLRLAKTSGAGPDPLERWLEVIYGARAPKPVVLVRRDDKQALAYAGNTVDSGVAAKEAGELIDLVMRTKRVPPKPVETKRGFLGFGASTPKELPLSTELRNLTNSRMGAVEVAGPPLGLADDVISAIGWRNRAVVMTSQRSNDGRTRLWIEDNVQGHTCFREIPTPPGLAPNGVTMVLAGDDIYLCGGVHPDGTTSKDVWVYPLGSATLAGLPQDSWRAGPPMEKGIAWPAVGVVGAEVFVLDGVTELAPSKKYPDLLLPIMTRGMRRLNNVRWLERAEPPSDFSGAQVASDRRVLVIGPGNRLDGRLWLCDTLQVRGEAKDKEAPDAKADSGGWYALPPLPKEVGLGEVFLADDKITYVAGFNKDGSPSGDVYQLDLNSLSGRWEHVGSSRFATGRARLVRRDGQWASIMVTPAASRMYLLE